MPRKFAKIIIIFIVILAIIFGALFFVSGKKGTGNPVNDIKDGTITFRDFSPFNPPIPSSSTENPTTNTPTENNPVTSPTASNSFTAPKIRKVTDFAVAGFTFFEKERPLTPSSTSPSQEEATGGGGVISTLPTTTTPPVTTGTVKGKTPPVVPTTEKVTTIRYLQKSNAHISDLFIDSENPTIVSNTTIPKIHDAIFSPDGKFVILRYLNETTGEIETFSATAPLPPTGDVIPDLKGVFLPENISTLSMSPDGTKIFSVSSFDGGVIGDISGLLGDKKTEILKSPFTEWLPQWVSAKTITITTKASSAIPGYLYAINIGTKKISRIMGNVPGLTMLMSPDEKHVLYAQTTATAITLSMYDTATHDSKDIGLNTLPSKCVWSKKGTSVYCGIPSVWPSGSYPDSWYQGAISFSDAIWKIDLVGGVFSLTELATAGDLKGESVDAVNLSLDSQEKYLGFINKKDGTLWSIQL